MDFDDFPFMKLPDVAQDVVVEKSTLESILRLSISSHVGHEIVKNAKVPTKEVYINLDSLKFRLHNGSQISWVFRKSETDILNYTFGNLMRTHKVIECQWETRCLDPQKALVTVFLHMAKLFKISTITSLKLEIDDSNANLPEDPFLQEVGKCHQLQVVIGTAVLEEHMKWLMDKLDPNGKLHIQRRDGIRLEYGLPYPAAKTIVLENTCFNREAMFSVTCTHLHLKNPHPDDVQTRTLNRFFAHWQEGALPNLEVFEVLSLQSLRSHPEVTYTREALLHGLNARDWDSSREHEFSLSLISFFTGIESSRTLIFPEAKDIVRSTDRMKASLIPHSTPRTFNGNVFSGEFYNFVFIVWSDSDWINKMRKQKVLKH